MVDHTLEFSTEIDASPDLVYRFFTEGELLERWHGVKAEVDPRPGGQFLVNVTGKDITRGEFVELDPGRRIVFSWGFEVAGSTTVEVTLTPKGNSTLVRLHHFGFDREEECDGRQRGWKHYLARLELAAAGRDPGSDSWRVAGGSPNALG